MNPTPILPDSRSSLPVSDPRRGLPMQGSLLSVMVLGAAMAFTGCKDAAKVAESSSPKDTALSKDTAKVAEPASPKGTALKQANPGPVNVLKPLSLKPKMFADLTGKCAIPDELALDGKGNILVSMPNCLEYEKFTPKIAMLDKDGNATDWCVTLPLHPKTNKVHPMGMEFGPDGNLYVSDNQYFNDKDHQSRILRVICKDGKPVSCEVAVEGTKLSNAIRFKGNDLYLTDTFFDLPDKRDQSGIWRFSLDEIGAGKPVVKVKPLGKDPHILASFTAKPQAAKADGTVEETAGADGAAFDSAGNLYVGLFGDGQFFKITFNPDGSLKSNEKIIDDPSFKCCDGIWCDPKTDKIYMANSARNSIHIYDARNHTLQMIWENADSDGKDGLLDQPCTACLLGNKLVIVNFDMPFPGLLNSKHDDPISVSYIEMP